MNVLEVTEGTFMRIFIEGEPFGYMRATDVELQKDYPEEPYLWYRSTVTGFEAVCDDDTVEKLEQAFQEHKKANTQ